MVDLFLIRHAEATPLLQGEVKSDADRPLTDDGESQSRAVGSALVRRGVKLRHVVSSPLLRARQTAEGIVSQWESDPPTITLCEDLAPAGKGRKVARFLRDLEGHTVAIVGHQPDLGLLAAWLIGSRKAQIDLAKAGFACIAFENDLRKGAGVLVSLLTPEWYTMGPEEPMNELI